MGRIKSTKNAGILKLRKDVKPKQNGEYAIYLHYTLDRKVAKGDAGVWVKEKDWDCAKQRVKSSNPNHSALNQRLKNYVNRVDSMIFDYSGSKRITIDVLREMVQDRWNPSKQQDVDFIELAKDVVDKRYKTGKNGIAVRDNAICSLNLFKKFLVETKKIDSIMVSEITEAIVDEYIIWRKDRGNDSTTINKALTPIMRAIREAANRDLCTQQLAAIIESKYLPIKKKLSEDEQEETEVRFLTEEQMKFLVKLRDQARFQRTKDYLDMFLFSFHACGLRFSDILTLQWSNIDFKQKMINKVMFKGRNTYISVPLTDKAIAILENWKTKGGKRFVFGLLPDDFDLSNEVELKRQRINKNTPIKVSLKAVGEKLSLPFNLTMHVARHTFAVLALNRGVEVHKISTLLGHSSVMVTEKVYAKFLPSTLEKEIGEKLNFDF